MFNHEKPHPCIDDLATPAERLDALIAALPAIEKEIGERATSRLFYGMPVSAAFAMTRSQIASHPRTDLLRTTACYLPLSYALPQTEFCQHQNRRNTNP